MKILQIGDIQGASSRLHFVTPENVEKFPNHYSLTRAVMYSPKCLNRIKALIRSKQGAQAYIVPGITNMDEIQLSIQLTCPILCGEP